MRIVSAELVGQGRLGRARERHRARIEGLALIVVTIVLALGIWLTYNRQIRELSAEPVVDLNVVSDSQALAPALHVFATAAERESAARATLEWIRVRGPLTHVGALARVTAAGTKEPVFTPLGIAALKPGLVVRTAGAYRAGILRAATLFFLAFWLLHVVRRVGGTTGDPLLVPAAQLLVGLSLMAMIGLRDPLRDTDAATGFVYGAVAGCALFAMLSFIDFENPRYRRSTLLPLGAAVALAAVLVVFGTGPGESGVKVNLLGVQPIEAIRLLAIFALASYFSRRWELLREISEPIGPSAAVRRLVQLPRARDVTPLILIVGTLLVFFVLQRDLGPALVIGCISLAMYGVARARVSLVGAGFLTLIAGFAAGYWLGVPATLARRVAIWMSPWNNTRTGGDQIAHALWAFASGGTVGAGTGVGDGYLVPAGQTDLIVAVIGEELGFVGIVVIALVYALLVWRILRISARAPGDYTAFLALGCALTLAVPAVIIVGGQLGVFPLSGVATPFLSFGKSSSIASFAALAIASAIAAQAGPVRPTVARQLRTVGWTLAGLAAVLVGRAAWIQVRHADEIVLRPALVRQADGDVRYRYNPRLLLAARMLPRGTVLDRTGYALATNDPKRAEPLMVRLRNLRVGVPNECPSAPSRCYPLGGLAFHALGESGRQVNWAARNTSFIERDWNHVLQGYDDHARPVEVRLADGGTSTVVERDYRELLPLLRHKGNSAQRDVQRLLQRTRDVQVTIDGPFQALVARALEARSRAAGSGRGAVVVIDPTSGAVLALASYPWPEIDLYSAKDTIIEQAALLDRARYGLYPPGSTFKLITAAAALNGSPADKLPPFMCERLEDGRVGARVRGLGRPIRDDVLDHVPHGVVDLRKGLVVSCNAYFAQLAIHLGPAALAGAAERTQIQVSSSPGSLKATLPYAGYGQGEVLSSPLRMARAVGAIATDGVIRDTPLVDDGENTSSSALRWLRPSDAAFLRVAMREVVTVGTGRSLAGHRVPIAGKTGTAEVNHAASHSWFVGFAPYGSARIAFAVILENAGYGGRVAAPLAGDIVAAAEAAGLLK